MAVLMEAVQAKSDREPSVSNVDERSEDAACDSADKAVESMGAASAVLIFSLAVFAINEDVPVLT